VWIDEYVPETKVQEVPKAPLPTQDLPF